MLKGYRTLLVNALGAALPILSMTEVIAVVPPEWIPYWMLGLALANMYLRTVTDTAVGKSE